MCAADEAQAYAQAIVGLIADPDKLDGIGAAARRASADYEWSRILGAVVGVYREALTVNAPTARAA